VPLTSGNTPPPLVNSYDQAGNLTSMQHLGGATGSWSRAYTIANDSNQLVSHSVSTGTVPFGYDSNGNMTSMPHLPGLLDWDDVDRLSRVDLGGGGRAYYRYDGSGQRMRKILVRQGGLVEERVCLGPFEEYRRHQGGNVTFRRTSVHVMDDTRRIALIETETTPGAARRVRYQLGNQLGSCMLELSETAAVVCYEEYHPYGTTALWLGASDVEASHRRFRYNGKEKDEETALYYYGARYYACWLGRWTSCDPSGLSDGPNRYSYVGGNPVSHVDPDGRALKQVQVGGLTISSNSQISAQQWVDMIKRNSNIPQWMKDCFDVSGNKIVLKLWIDTAKPKQSAGPLLPPGATMPPWFETTLVAIKEKEWHLTTGVSIVTDPSDKFRNKLIGDHEPGDEPTLSAAKAGAGNIFLGETIPAESKGITSIFGRQMLDARAGGGTSGAGGLRRGPSPGGAPAEGLIVVANRFRDTLAPGIEVLRSEDALLGTFFHELGAHAGLITQLQSAESEHASPDPAIGLLPMSTADVNAMAIRAFFGHADETRAVEFARAIGPTGTAKITKALQELDKAMKDLQKAMKQLETRR
jgi:RHS repeat-associated protein